MARRTLNIPFNTSLAASANAQGAADLFANISDAGIEIRPGMTIVRIRGHMNITNTTSTTPVPFAVAMMMTPEGGFGVVPALFTEIVNAVWRTDGTTRVIHDEVAAGVFEARPDIYPIESRGQRKVARVGDELRLVLAHGGGVSISVQVSGTVRIMLE